MDGEEQPVYEKMQRNLRYKWSQASSDLFGLWNPSREWRRE